MAKCEVCGNDYELSFQVVTAGVTHTFDSFECAIHKLAPVCAHCGVKVIGHGVEGNNEIFCCANCARQAGVIAIFLCELFGVPVPAVRGRGLCGPPPR